MAASLRLMFLSRLRGQAVSDPRDLLSASGTMTGVAYGVMKAKETRQPTLIPYALGGAVLGCAAGLFPYISMPLMGLWFAKEMLTYDEYERIAHERKYVK